MHSTLGDTADGCVRMVDTDRDHEKASMQESGDGWSSVTTLNNPIIGCRRLLSSITLA